MKSTIKLPDTVAVGASVAVSKQDVPKGCQQVSFSKHTPTVSHTVFEHMLALSYSAVKEVEQGCPSEPSVQIMVQFQDSSMENVHVDDAVVESTISTRLNNPQAKFLKVSSSVLQLCWCACPFQRLSGRHGQLTNRAISQAQKLATGQGEVSAYPTQGYVLGPIASTDGFIKDAVVLLPGWPAHF
eukprot:217760-Chlamydomonas_euryale.AAC.1